MIEILSRLGGTLQFIFKIGRTTPVALKNNSGRLDVRNEADSAYLDAAVKQLRLQGNNATDAIVHNAPNSLSATTTYTWPAADGSTGQKLTTDGAGTLSWEDSDANAIKVEVVEFDQGDAGTFDLLTVDNQNLLTIEIAVTSAAGGGAPTLNIGTAGDPDAYFDETEINLGVTGIYRINYAALALGTDDVIATLAADSQNFSGRIVLHYATPS